MILKGRDAPLNILGLAVLMKRLPKNHEKYGAVQDKYLSAKAGRGGEDEFDRLIEKYELGQPHLVLHDLSLNQDFQVDSLFITPSTIHLFEIKNLGGKPAFHSNPLRVEVDYEERKGRVIDLSQMDRASFYLERWLFQRGMQLPISRAFVLPYPKKFENHTNLTVLFPNTVFPYIRSFRRGKDQLDEGQMMELGEQLKLRHRAFQPFPLCSRWGIDPRDLLTGVECEKCMSLGMNKVPRGWHCRRCGHFNSNAHERAMEEYFMLVGETITNQECRWFLSIDDRFVANRIMNGMNLKRDGSNRGSIYHFDYQTPTIKWSSAHK